ncbi:hypothetical protein NUW54_g11517 [Trametes sanguinea]|uniref:Uncharacterized protein n=1 Tax=Trametes sanguinea TaxID=158606 RepID=A0ACC1ND70_9APHY|nr:hypothetical protein NUW54_g11517 [Trametes sanguinea]
MLFSGPVALCKIAGLPEGVGEANPGVCSPVSSGDGGVESPRTAVFGRKREAMMTLWCLSELIAVVDGGEEGGGRGSVQEKAVEVVPFEKAISSPIGDVTCSARPL